MKTELLADEIPRHDGEMILTSCGLDASEPAHRLMLRYVARTKLPMMCVDARTGVVLAKSDDALREFLPSSVASILGDVDDVCVIEHPGGINFFVLPLPDVLDEKVVAVGYVPSRADLDPDDFDAVALEAQWSRAQLEVWLRRQPGCPTAFLESLLKCAVDDAQRREELERLNSELRSLSEQIDYRYEEISLLHSLAQKLQISRAPAEVAELCLNRVHGLIEAAGSVVWLDDGREPYQFLVQGVIPFDELGMAKLISRFEDHDWSTPLVRNNIGRTLLGADFPGLDSLVVVSIAEGCHRWGWLLSCNRLGGREFGTVEASLLNSIAAILGTHVRNIDLYREYDELLLSFVRSLVSTLDAKDPYTRGHSERVALIARRLGQELNLPENDLRDIYLSSLLHDIGKIGVDDGILQKPDQLSADEFKKIQQHPKIGYLILAGLKNLQAILPGVRNHHESYNGTGYPDNLKGEEIPLMARIISVADAYDAMGSDRPYRKGMPLDQLEEIFRRGANKQWDARVIDAYFAAREDVKQICKTYSLAEGNLLSGPNHLHQDSLA